MLDEARAVLATTAGAGVVAADPTPDPCKATQAEKAKWHWYIEWSTLARHELKDRRLLMSLGFLRSYKKRTGDDAVEDDEIDDLLEDDTAEEDVVEDDLVPVPV